MLETSRPMVGKLSDNDGMIHKPYISRSSAKPAFIRHEILHDWPYIDQS